MDRVTRLAPLGYQRLRLLDCLGGNSPKLPGYFHPDEHEDILLAFRNHAARLSEEWAAEPDPITNSLVAAARFLSGDLESAHLIIDLFPAEAFKLDHGAGYCVVAPLHAVCAALPLPNHLKDTQKWIAGSAEQVALRSWLAANRNQLTWDHESATYSLC